MPEPVLRSSRTHALCFKKERKNGGVRPITTLARRVPRDCAAELSDACARVEPRRSGEPVKDNQMARTMGGNGGDSDRVLHGECALAAWTIMRLMRSLVRGFAQEQVK